MTTLIKLTETSGAEIYVNPDLVTYVRVNRSNAENSTIYFARDHYLEVKDGLAATVTALTS